MKTDKKKNGAIQSIVFAASLLCLSTAGIAQQTWNLNLNDFPVGDEAQFGTSTETPILFKTNGATRMTFNRDGAVLFNGLAADMPGLLMVDANGILSRVPTPMPAGCGGTMPWFQGGNTIGPLLLGNITNEIGTCDDQPFVLKAYNKKSLILHPSGKIAIGLGWVNTGQTAIVDIVDPSGSNTNHLMLYGNAAGAIESNANMALYNNSGNFGIYNGNQASPSARFLASAAGHMNIYNTGNFIINGGTPGNSLNYFSIDVNGFTQVSHKLGVGTSHGGGVATLGVDGMGSIGLLVNCNNGNEALRVSNSAGAPRFKFIVNSGGNDDSRCHIAGSTQIGFYSTVGVEDATTRLNVDANSLHGVKVSTQSNTNKMFHVSNNNITTFEVKGDGTTYIGSARPAASPGVAAAAKLTVDGMILARDIRVSNSQGTHWADFVFEKDYELMPLSDIESFVAKNKHLPGVPSEAEVKKDGVDLMEMNVQLLQKVEELYLHTIQLQKQIDELKSK